MTNLGQKFGSFEEQLATQHAELLAALGTIGTKLDAMTVALGGTPTTPTATLTDVVDAIAATNTILGDVHLDTISMDQKLLRIRDALNPLGESLPLEDHSSIPWLLFRIMDAMNPSWPRPTSVPLQPAMHALLALAQVQYPNLASIHAALGNPTGDATTTALGLLSSIQYSNAGIYNSIGMSTGDDDTVIALLKKEVDCGCAQGGMASNGGSCAHPFVSSGMQLIPFSAVGGNSVIVAVWSDPLPAGISYGTLFGLTNQYAELYKADWSGWRVLVQSDEQQYADSATSTSRYPTGVWRALPAGAANYSWAVSERGSIKVTLCAPADFSTGEPFVPVEVAPITCQVPAQLYLNTGGGPHSWEGDMPTGATVVVIGAAGDGNSVVATVGDVTFPAWSGGVFGGNKYYAVQAGTHVSVVKTGGDVLYVGYCGGTS